jgi:glyoxylase-like metal-dependent hydrolase (beta-lactamase superfamily II)
MEVVSGLHWVERIWDTKVYVIVEDKGLIVVDAATPGRASAVWRHLEGLGYPPQAVRQIWLTHGDVDHMGSVAALKATSGAEIVAHQADVSLVEGRADRALGSVPLAGIYHRLFNWGIRCFFRPTKVDCPVNEGDLLGNWQVVHVPGHTPGSVCYYHPGRGIVLVGDAINHRQGQLGAPPEIFTYDMGQAHASIQKIAGLDFEVCCFGHGPPLIENAQQRVQAFASSLA